MKIAEPCPYCHGSFERLYQHQCPLEPAAFDELRTFLHRHARDGIIMPLTTYSTRSKGTGLPSETTLLNVIGDWSEVAERFGLLPRSSDPEAECPHCAREFTKKSRSAHIQRCPKNPVVFALLQKFVTDNFDNGVLPPVTEYRATVEQLGAAVPTTSLLVSTYGSWTNVAEALGMALARTGRFAHDQERVWDALQKWFAATDPPYQGVAWNQYAMKNELPRVKRITELWDVSWRDIVEEMGEAPYPIRNDEELASEYRPPVKVRLSDKQRAERLCAGIKDESERLRVWFTALGYSSQVVDLWA